MPPLAAALRDAIAFLAASHAVWLREVVRMLRDRGQLVGAVSRPILWVLIFGIGLSPYFAARGGADPSPAFDYVAFVVPAVVALNLMYPAVQSAVSLIWDREFGFLREVFASPAPRGAVFFGKLLGGATVAMTQGLLVLILAPLAGVWPSPGGVLAALPAMAAVALAFSALGLALAARMRSFQGFGVFANTLILPAFFLAGSIFPLDPAAAPAAAELPRWLVMLVQINPVTYGVDELRAALLGSRQFDAATSRVVLAAFVVVPVTLAYVRFRR